MRRDDIRAMVKELTPRGFCAALACLLEGRDQAGSQIRKIRAEDVSIRALFEGMVGQSAEDYFNPRAAQFNYVEMQEAIDSTGFPSATGVLIASKVIEGYESVPTIGDELVTPMPSRLKSERIPGFTTLEGPREVPEGMPYEDSSFTEKYVTTETAKKGRILEVTEEAILFDQTGQILVRASRLGERTREEREKTILAGVVDVGSGAVGYKDVYRPSGTAAALYSAANSNYQATTTALVDWTDLDEIFQYHATNVSDDRAIASEQDPITWMPKILLVSRKKWGTAARILNATQVRSVPGSTTGESQINPNPIQTFVPGLRALSSPYLDRFASVTGSRYTQSDDWLFGDFKKQFIWQEIWPVQTFRARQDDEAQFRRDVVARFKVRYYGGLAATDTRWVVKVKGA